MPPFYLPADELSDLDEGSPWLAFHGSDMPLLASTIPPTLELSLYALLRTRYMAAKRDRQQRHRPEQDDEEYQEPAPAAPPRRRPVTPEAAARPAAPPAPAAAPAARPAPPQQPLVQPRQQQDPALPAPPQQAMVPGDVTMQEASDAADPEAETNEAADSDSTQDHSGTANNASSDAADNNGAMGQPQEGGAGNDVEMAEAAEPQPLTVDSLYQLEQQTTGRLVATAEEVKRGLALARTTYRAMGIRSPPSETATFQLLAKGLAESNWTSTKALALVEALLAGWAAQREHDRGPMQSPDEMLAWLWRRSESRSNLGTVLDRLLASTLANRAEAVTDRLAMEGFCRGILETTGTSPASGTYRTELGKLRKMLTLGRKCRHAIDRLGLGILVLWPDEDVSLKRSHAAITTALVDAVSLADRERGLGIRSTCLTIGNLLVDMMKGTLTDARATEHLSILSSQLQGRITDTTPTPAALARLPAQAPASFAAALANSAADPTTPSRAGPRQRVQSNNDQSQATYDAQWMAIMEDLQRARPTNFGFVPATHIKDLEPGKELFCFAMQAIVEASGGATADCAIISADAVQDDYGTRLYLTKDVPEPFKTPRITPETRQ